MNQKSQLLTLHKNSSRNRHQIRKSWRLWDLPSRRVTPLSMFPNPSMPTPPIEVAIYKRFTGLVRAGGRSNDSPPKKGQAEQTSPKNIISTQASIAHLPLPPRANRYQRPVKTTAIFCFSSFSFFESFPSRICSAATAVAAAKRGGSVTYSGSRKSEAKIQSIPSEFHFDLFGLKNKQNKKQKKEN